MDERDREAELRGFSRGGFAPIPHRHHELPPPPMRDDRFGRPDMYDGRDMREFPRRDLDMEAEDRWERRERDEWDRRARPPHWEDDWDRPKRRRSPSPLGPSHRPRLRSPSPSRFPGPSSSLPDPASLEYLLNFRQFAEWFRASHPQTAKADEEELRRVKAAIEEGTAPESATKEKVGMGKRYERYRKEYSSRQLFALYLSHRASPWFQERYSHLPEFVALRRRVNRQGRVPTVEKYLDGLRAGEHDAVSFEMTEDPEKKPGGSRRYSDHEEPEGLDRALGDTAPTEEATRVEVAPKERQVFVKTVPPTISRKELEALFAQEEGFEYLALAEPSAKKAFHRVAWAQFADGVDVEKVVERLDNSKIDNFVLHMTVNLSPTVGRVRVTAPIANTLDRLLHDGEKAKTLALRLEEELLGDDEEEFKEGEDHPPEGDKGDENKVAGLREKGSDMVEDHIGRLLEREGLLNEDLSEEQRTRKAKLILDHWISYLRDGLSTCYYCVAPMSFPEELQRKCISHVRPQPDVKPEGELEVVPEVPEAAHEGENGKPSSSEKLAEENGDKEEKADAEERERERDGDREQREPEAEGDKSGGRERPKKVFAQKSNDEKWSESLDHKIRPLIDAVDVVDYGGRDIEEETRKLTAPAIKQEEASKYRCKECNKLFRAPEFVIKHITVKHPEVVNSKLDDFQTLNNFVLDPQHLPATLQTPAAVDDRLPTLPPAVIPGQGMFNPAFVGGPVGGGGFANGGGQNAGMMQQQMMMMMQMQQAMMMQMAGGGGGGGGGGGPGIGMSGTGMGLGMGGGGGVTSSAGRGLADRMGGYAPQQDASATASPIPLPLAPPGGEDPRARRGRVSYKDLDEPGGAGDGGLPY